MYDYHTHTDMSSDGHDSLRDMVKRAMFTGLDEYAVTDHYDYDYKDRSIDFDLDVDEYFAALTSMVARCNTPGSRFRFVRGIEIGLQTGAANIKNSEVVSSHDFDFVIASIHCAWGCAVDIPEYHENRDPETAAKDFYDYTVRCLEEYDDFDVLGHINFIDRFTRVVPDEDEVWEHVDAVIKKIVDMGKGLEVNTKILRVLGGAHTTPTMRMLQRYAELGGETVTTGSDAHRVAEVGAGLKEAENFIRAAGLRYIAAFRDRKISYKKL
ncbi:MAG: histidinol-phosphatase HisJ family protein [Clostridiales Family XIII bacterium]|jgi:histidinol-phosphatase (PHP family)|nr:histidinol-phosphatase HisJ family protein [Clostridiales Family XIII bacterium]